MRAKPSAKKNSTARLGRVPWNVVDVRVLPKYRLVVRFADGLEGEVDVEPFLFRRDAGVFEPLKDPAKFAEAYVEDGAVTWPGGQELAPDAMYDDIKAMARRVAGGRPRRR